MTYLLDVNLLVALSRRDHALHGRGEPLVRRAPGRRLGHQSTHRGRPGAVVDERPTLRPAGLVVDPALGVVAAMRAVEGLHPDDRHLVEVIGSR